MNVGRLGALSRTPRNELPAPLTVASPISDLCFGMWATGANRIETGGKTDELASVRTKTRSNSSARRPLSSQERIIALRL